MAIKRLLVTVDSHTQGEPTRLVIGGITHFPGRTMKERQAFVAREHDDLRAGLMAEPRGHLDMFGGFITPPATADGDLGIVYMDNQGYLDMCGHGTIGLCTVLVELGMVKATPPRTEIKIDTPAGRVLGYALSENDKVVQAGFQNVPSYCVSVCETVPVEGLGQVQVGLSYGGNFFAIVEAQSIGVELSMANMETIRDRGMRIKRAVTQYIRREPDKYGFRKIDIVTLYGAPSKPGPLYRNAHIFGPGQVDRSPGGTGTSAMLAFLIAKGKMDARDNITSQGLAGGLFGGRIVKTWEQDGRVFHTPEISGIAHITGINHFFIGSPEELPEGLRAT